MADEGSEQTLRNNLHIIQSMIDVSAERLEGLRTQCATSAELTQQEIRTLEGKLIKLFSDQLVTKLKLKNGCDEHIPSLTQWLQVVGLGKASILGICQKISSVEELQEKSEHELRTILNEKGARPEELSRLFRALHNLKRYTDVLKRGDKDASDMHLYWDSWDRHHQLKGGLSPRPGRSRAARASVPSEESLLLNNNNRGGMKFPTTPPARRKHLTGNPPALLPDSYPLTKSKSHESQLAASKSENDTNPSNGTGTVGRRARLPTEPGPDTMGYTSPLLTSPIKSPLITIREPTAMTIAISVSLELAFLALNLNCLQVPKSPRTPPVRGRIMTHQINHRFTKTFKMMSSCGYCQKPIYFGTGLKCKECKYTCHRDCEDKVAPSCGLPPELLDEFKKKLSMEGQVFVSPTTGRASNTKNIMNSLTRNRNRKSSHPQPLINTPPFPPPDSSSNTSSCNSSTPSSPAVQALTTPHASHKSTFHFPGKRKRYHPLPPLLMLLSLPDITHNEANEVTLETHPLLLTTALHHDLIGSQQSRDSDRTASQTSGSTSTDSDRTPVRVDSQDSQVSDSETITDGHRRLTFMLSGPAPEAIIWQVGKGMKQPLANLQASRDVKDILMLCWSFRPGDRPDFIRLLNILDKLPKKRLARSPSHPIHLSRSAESVF
ncbi:hypothetical protein NQ317_008697 [Molorchus minor]|uniref:Phorbol-ester/DAG-type domain-containing protein n=1 Tax=Molorchus minor TaxID=1323400 RepID=A0ABQ9K343_9CUCU|nr:hypothetical protein NQ317_008697 [Molorchus minor]